MLKQTHKILVVDDEPINRRMLAKLLEKEFKPFTASSGEEALEILKRERVSLLISDQRMPGMKGTELLRSCKAIDQNMVCMLMSAIEDNEAFLDAIVKSGAVRVINKPWDAEKLLQDIRASLETYESLMENKQSIDRLKEATRRLGQLVPPAMK